METNLRKIIRHVQGISEEHLEDFPDYLQDPVRETMDQVLEDTLIYIFGNQAFHEALEESWKPVGGWTAEKMVEHAFNNTKIMEIFKIMEVGEERD